MTIDGLNVGKGSRNLKKRKKCVQKMSGANAESERSLNEKETSSEST